MRTLLLILCTLSATAQTAEINEQVWKPFCEGLSTLDTTRYLSVHSRHLIRAEIGNKKIYGYDQYSNNTRHGFEQALKSKHTSPEVQFSVELRFLDRISSNDRAYEVGYFKSTLSFPDGRTHVYYSPFYVALIREGGRWKIRTDSSLPLPQLTEEEFKKAQPL